MSCNDESIEVPLHAPVPQGESLSGSEPLVLQRVKIPISVDAAPPAVVTPTEDRFNICGSSAKVGRWSDVEHKVFLEGLALHGKQWKTIAGMIGTRSVVQVRTHAQKYFQKLERKTKSSGSPSHKRKSLASTLPPREVKKPKRMSTRLSLSNKQASSSNIHSNVRPPSAYEVPAKSPPKQAAAPKSPTNASETFSDFVEPMGSPHTVTEYFDEQAAALDLLSAEPLEWLLDSELSGIDVLSDEALVHIIDDPTLQP